MIWQLSRIIIYYLSGPTTTSVEYKYGTRLDFPAVTICNQNPFRTSRAMLISDNDFQGYYQKNKNGTGGTGVKVKGSGNQASGSRTQKQKRSIGSTEAPDQLDQTTQQQKRSVGSTEAPDQLDQSNSNSTNGSFTDFDWDLVDYSEYRADYDVKQEFYARYMKLSDQNQANVGYTATDMVMDCSWGGKSCSPA